MKNGLSGVSDFWALRPLDRLVGHVGHEVVVRVLRQLDAAHVLVDGRRPLVRFAADEAVELVEAGAGRPAVGRAGGADFPGGGLVRLAEGGRAVAVEPQHLGQRRDAVGPLPGLAGEGGRGLGDRAHVADVMVAAGQQRRAGRRAERRGVELVVAQPALRQPLERRHVDRPAEGARLAEAHVVDQHDEHVRAPWPAPSPRTAAGPWRCGRRASVIGGSFGSGIGRTVRSVGSTTGAGVAP